MDSMPRDLPRFFLFERGQSIMAASIIVLSVLALFAPLNSVGKP